MISGSVAAGGNFPPLPCNKSSSNAIAIAARLTDSCNSPLDASWKDQMPVLQQLNKSEKLDRSSILYISLLQNMLQLPGRSWKCWETDARIWGKLEKPQTAIQKHFLTVPNSRANETKPCLQLSADPKPFSFTDTGQLGPSVSSLSFRAWVYEHLLSLSLQLRHTNTTGSTS